MCQTCVFPAIFLILFDLGNCFIWRPICVFDLTNDMYSIGAFVFMLGYFMVQMIEAVCVLGSLCAMFWIGHIGIALQILELVEARRFDYMFMDG